MRWLPLLLLLLAMPAWGQGWSASEAGTDDYCGIIAGATPLDTAGNNTCFYNLAQADTTNSPAINTSACRWVNFHVNTNTGATTTGGEVTLYGCVSATVNTNTCNPIYTDAGAVTLNGDSSVGRADIYGAAAAWMFLVVSDNTTGALRGVITCH